MNARRERWMDDGERERGRLSLIGLLLCLLMIMIKNSTYTSDRVIL